MARRSGTQTPVSILDGTPIPKLQAYVIDTLMVTDATIGLINILAERSLHKIIFVETSFTEASREAVAVNLRKRVILYDLLMMRLDRDVRPAWMVWQDIYEKSIHPTFDVVGVFTTQQDVAWLWRRYGIVSYLMC